MGVCVSLRIYINGYMCVFACVCECSTSLTAHWWLNCCATTSLLCVWVCVGVHAFVRARNMLLRSPIHSQTTPNKTHNNKYEHIA